jgi:transglutaminase-like putative cysteine protease
MAEMEWTRRGAEAPARELPTWLQPFAERYADWEDWLTLAMLGGATFAVAATLESGGWAREMPALTLVALLAVLASFLFSRSRLSVLVAWPAAVATGVLVVAWQTLVMVGPGSPADRADAVYERFDAWLNAAFNDLVNNDPLPLNVLTLGMTWVGAFLFGWSVFRWNNAWIGLIPGGLALFLDLAYVGDELSGAVLAYVLLGFLLIMRTNLLAMMSAWRRDAIGYPPLISLTFLNFSFWVLLVVLIGAWIAPLGPFATPAPVQSLVDEFHEFGAGFVRLAGPLHVKKVVPVHTYVGVLPFQGSVELGDREVMELEVRDPDLVGPFVLRGTAYDRYASGGWDTGQRVDAELSPAGRAELQEQLDDQSVTGKVVPLHINLLAKSVVGNVLFTLGQPVSTNPEVTAKVPAGSLRRAFPVLPEQGRDMPDSEIYRDYLDEGLVGVSVSRDSRGRVEYVLAFDTEDAPLMDTISLEPGSRIQKGKGYDVNAFVGTVTQDQLRAAGEDYPGWVQQYLQLPDGLPERIGVATRDTVDRAAAANGQSSPYDSAKAIEGYLRAFPVTYDVPDTPPGQDTVDYFLFETQRGYFDYHASAMVVMLRTLGIPSRMGVGFVVDEGDRDREGEKYIVRDRNAYAWAEVYFPGAGWIVFNPSQDRAADLNPRVVEEPDVSEGIDPAILENLPVGADPIFDIPPEAFGAGGAASAPPSSGNSYSPWFAIGIAAIAAMVSGAVFVGWQRSVSGLPYAEAHWEKLVRLSSWAGYPPQPGQTPVEFARGLQKVHRGLRGVSLLAAAYSRSRFAHREPTLEERERIGELWPDMRGALLGKIAGRVFRRN